MKGDENAHYLNRGVGSRGVYIDQNSLNCNKIYMLYCI